MLRGKSLGLELGFWNEGRGQRSDTKLTIMDILVPLLDYLDPEREENLVFFLYFVPQSYLELLFTTRNQGKNKFIE